MAGITADQAQTQLDAWLAASTAVVSGQSYSIAGRTLTRVNASEIREQISYWNKMVTQLSRGGISVRGITPI